MNRFLHIGLSLSLLAASSFAQTYTAQDLGVRSVGNVISAGFAAGQLNLRATVWDAVGNPIDLHPTFLDSPGGSGTSAINGRAGVLSVGVGAPYAARGVALRWDDSVAAPLTNPFPVYYSTALATDGRQILGTATPFDLVKDVTVPGAPHPILWDAQTGAVIADLYDGKPIVVSSVAGGQQVGYGFAGLAVAQMWNSARRPVISLHPKAFETSMASGTDGVHQIGMVGTSVKLFDEVHRNFQVLLTNAVIWTGTAESYQILPFYSSTQPISTSQGVAIAGNFACGIGTGRDRVGTVKYNHAVAWNLAAMSFVDLHDSLPAGFTSSRPTGVDVFGNVTGWAIDSSGSVHGIVWRAS